MLEQRVAGVVEEQARCACWTAEGAVATWVMLVAQLHFDAVVVFADAAGHFEEDAMNLGELFVEQADEFVILLDGFQGFDVDGLATGAGAVNYALDAAFLLNFDGDDEAFAAD